jgi:hypothetical protein
MKNLFLLFCFIPVFVNAQVLTFFEDFEGAEFPTDWTVVDEGNQNGDEAPYTWKLDLDNGYNDSQCAWVDCYPSGPADDWLISPQVQLTDDYEFTFWAYCNSSSFPDSYMIMVSKTGTDPADFTIELDDFVNETSYVKYSYTPTDNADLSEGDNVYFAIYCYSEGSRTYVDDIYYGESQNPSIQAGYCVSNDAIDVVFDLSISGDAIPAANYELRGSETITFSSSEIDSEDDKILHLSGASSSIDADLLIDSIYNTVTDEYAKFYAGIQSVAVANQTNPSGYITDSYVATFQLTVMAKNGSNRVWLAEGSGARLGTNSYGTEFHDAVEIGDDVILYSEISPYQFQTELYLPTIIEIVSSGNELFDPTVISGSDIDTLLAADTDPAESYEGVLVTVPSSVVTEWKAPYFIATDDSETTFFRIGDAFGLFDGTFDETTLQIGNTYDFTGFIANRDSVYRIVPRNLDDITSMKDISQEMISISPNPASEFITIVSDIHLEFVEIYDLTGRIVNKFNENFDRIPVNKLSEGFYIINIHTNDGTLSKKISIVR